MHNHKNHAHAFKICINVEKLSRYFLKNKYDLELSIKRRHILRTIDKTSTWSIVNWIFDVIDGIFEKPWFRSSRLLNVFNTIDQFKQNWISYRYTCEWRHHQLSTTFVPNTFSDLHRRKSYHSDTRGRVKICLYLLRLELTYKDKHKYIGYYK